MSEAKYYCLCDDNCKYETMTKEQILAAIMQAIETGNVCEPSAAFIEKVKEYNRGDYVSFWIGTQAQYNALSNIETNCMYIITDDTTGDDIQKAAAEALRKVEELEARMGNNATIDITDKISFQRVTGSGGDNLGRCELKVDKAVYVPSTGIVYFVYEFWFGNGKVSDREEPVFIQVGGYTPSVPTTATVQKRWDDLSVAYGENENEIAIRFQNGTDFGGETGMEMITGWYFCNGEGN